jgi:hypothetical protein
MLKAEEIYKNNYDTHDAYISSLEEIVAELLPNCNEGLFLDTLELFMYLGDMLEEEDSPSGALNAQDRYFILFLMLKASPTQKLDNLEMVLNKGAKSRNQRSYCDVKALLLKASGNFAQLSAEEKLALILYDFILWDEPNAGLDIKLGDIAASKSIFEKVTQNASLCKQLLGGFNDNASFEIFQFFNVEFNREGFHKFCLERWYELSSEWNEIEELELVIEGVRRDFHPATYINNPVLEDYEKGYPAITVGVRKKDNGEPNEELQAQISKYLKNWQCPTKAYNGLIGYEVRVPSWIGKIDNPDCCPKFSDQDIAFINSTILKDKIIPILNYAPDEFNYKKEEVWWIVPLSFWAGEKASWLFIDTDGIYAAHPGDDDIEMIFSWDDVENMQYFTEDSDTYESEVHSLNLTTDNGDEELTFIEFVPPGRGSYLSVVKSLYEIRKATIVASKGESQWFEGSGGEGYKSFEHPKDLLDSSKWDNPNRPIPSNFGFVENEEDIVEENDMETDFQLEDFDVSDESVIDFISDKIQKGKYLTNLLYVNNTLEKNDFEVDNHQAYFFDSDVLITDRELSGFLLVNMDGFYSNCISEDELNMLVSWDAVTNLVYSESDSDSSIDIITEQGELTIKKINSYSLKILNTFYISLWKEIIEKFKDEPFINWGEVWQLGVTEIGFNTIQEYKDFKIK